MSHHLEMFSEGLWGLLQKAFVIINTRLLASKYQNVLPRLRIGLTRDLLSLKNSPSEEGRLFMEVLLVDDHSTVNEVFSALASKVFKGANINVAKDLETALHVAASSAPNLVLLDLGLPGCSGIEALERFRAAFPAAPVLVVSSIEDAAYIQATLDAGACGYIAKTASLDGIAAAMKVVAGGGRYVPYKGLSLPSH